MKMKTNLHNQLTKEKFQKECYYCLGMRGVGGAVAIALSYPGESILKEALKKP